MANIINTTTIKFLNALGESIEGLTGQAKTALVDFGTDPQTQSAVAQYLLTGERIYMEVTALRLRTFARERQLDVLREKENLVLDAMVFGANLITKAVL